jgi:hypothetical protein
MESLLAGLLANKFVVMSVAGLTWLFNWILANREKIQAIVLRVEKESEDGWTPEEKEQLAVDVFFKEIYPNLPNTSFMKLIVAIIPKSLVEKVVRSMIKGICAKAKVVKQSVQAQVK